MKTWWLALLIAASCSSWKQKDFEKDLEKSPDSAPVITEVQAPIMEKFEVKEVAAEAPPSVKKVAVTKKKEIPAKKVVVEKAVAPEEKKLPADYPPELLATNEKAKKVWDAYKPNHHVDEKIYLDIHYLGMTVGKIMVTNKGKKMIDNKEVWHLHARFKSAPFYSNIYELDDTVDTYVSTDKFLSMKYTVIQRESKVNVDDIQLIDHESLKVYWLYHSKRLSDGKKKNKKEEKFIPYYSIDPFSTLFLYQGLPLKNGDVYEIPVVNKGKVLIMRTRVEARETIETETGTRKAIRLQATTQYTGDQLKSGDITFWFSDDEKRSLLKAKAKISLGSVTADIVKE
ncbi:MAG: DUF3108 domain-containing protein [Bdellovibrionota bacterium]